MDVTSTPAPGTRVAYSDELDELVCTSCHEWCLVDHGDRFTKVCQPCRNGFGER